MVGFFWGMGSWDWIVSEIGIDCRLCFFGCLSELDSM